MPTHRLQSSSFLWLIFRILFGNPKKKLLRSLWVVIMQAIQISVVELPRLGVWGLGFREFRV